MQEYPDPELCAETHRHPDAVTTAKQHLPQEETLTDLAELFKTFGDPTRIRILYLLAEREMCVCDIAAAMGLTQPAASYQLKTLKRWRLVKNRREGKTVLYALADDHVAWIIGAAREHLEEI